MANPNCKLSENLRKKMKKLQEQEKLGTIGRSGWRRLFKWMKKKADATTS